MSTSNPIRRISFKCWKRFSNTVSTITDSPTATAWAAVICDCISVGNPGCGKVLTLVAFSFSGPTTRSPDSSWVKLTPISLSFEINGRLCSAIASLIKTSPCVIAAATMKVPASIRSWTTEWFAPCIFSTPLIIIVSVPAPLTFAPILFRRFAKSTISGSRAAFSSVVVPSASVAARIRFWVAPTDGKSR